MNLIVNADKNWGIGKNNVPSDDNRKSCCYGT